MQRSLSELNTDALSDQARATLAAVHRIENDGEPLDQVLAELGITEAELEQRKYALAQEWRQQGASIEIPPLAAEEYAALRDSIAAVGQQVAIKRAPHLDGWIVDGLHRERACRELGIDPRYEDVDGTRDQLESLALVLNMARRQLSTGARRGIVQAELLRDPSRSDRAIATAVGVSPTTVGSVRRELEAAGEVSKLDSRQSRDGKTRPATQPPRPRTATAAAEHELLDGVVDVTLRIARTIADQLDGSAWLTCKAVRLALVDPGIYSLEVQT